MNSSEQAQARAAEIRAEITKLQGELKTTEESIKPTPKPMKRTAFDKLDARAQAEHVHLGGTIFD
jgi:peptidoglycan hydrolase CwlO-like protein